MATPSLTANLLNTVNANNALSALFASQASFGNPLALAQTAQAVEAFRNEFPSQQVLALSGLFTQLTALNSAAVPLASPTAQANSLLVATGSPVLPSSLYNQTSATSSNTGAVVASSKAGAALTSYQIGVNQLAVAQTNTGTAFVSATANNAAGGVGLAAGTGRVEVTLTGTSVVAVADYFVTNAANTNQTVLTTVGNAINAITSNRDLQTVTLNGASSGNFTLTFNGQTTAAISAAGSPATVAAAIQTALRNLSGVGAANVNVAATSNGTYLIGFTGALANTPLPKLQATNVSLNSGASGIAVNVIGPTATVANSGGNSTLTVTANAPGSANAFTLSDVSNTGITGSGAGTVSTSAQDAIYTLNGAIYRATAANSTTIDNGNVALTFSATTSSPATVTVAANNIALTSAVTNLATAYNNLQGFLSANSQFLTRNLSQQAEKIITTHGGSLAALGITGNSDLAVDQTKLSDANAAVVQSVFSGPGGIADQLASMANTVLTSVESPLAAAPAAEQNNSQVATGLAALFEPLLVSSGLGANLSLKA